MRIDEIKLVIVGATGLVGNKVLEIMTEREISPAKIEFVASERSSGKTIIYNGKESRVITLDEAIKKRFDIAIFAAGSKVSIKWAPRFAENGSIVIDKSSAWRTDPKCPLVVPQVNPEALDDIPKKIVASPNCSTSGLVIALKPILARFGIPQYIFVATYQSVSGAGKRGNYALQKQRKGDTCTGIFEKSIFDNVIPIIGEIDEFGFNIEETKLVAETRKILGAPELNITATAVRIPIMLSHSEAVTLVFDSPTPAAEAIKNLTTAPGLKLIQIPDYPTPLEAADIDDVLVGRIRNTPSNLNILSMFISFDNLRRGAASNAVDLMEVMARKL
ncbi:aspartate-semialdehyde dehydrogenase [bacterium]|nr:aspartate-semialdehyde dehydrogenase [bacterium]